MGSENQSRTNCVHSCPIHPDRLESFKSTNDSTYRKSSRKRKRILCLPEVKLIHVGGYNMLTTRHDSFQCLSTRLDESRLELTRPRRKRLNKHQDRNISKPKHDRRILCIARSINVCKQMIRFKRFFTARYESL